MVTIRKKSETADTVLDKVISKFKETFEDLPVKHFLDVTFYVNGREEGYNVRHILDGEIIGAVAFAEFRNSSNIVVYPKRPETAIYDYITEADYNSKHLYDYATPEMAVDFCMLVLTGEFKVI